MALQYKVRSLIRTSIGLSLAATMLACFQNCAATNPIQFGTLKTAADSSAPTPSPSPAPAPSPSPSSSSTSCTVEQVAQNLRILFMVDNSGSTSSTDPHDSQRVATVQTFLNTYGSKTNLTYSYSYFAQKAMTYDADSNSFDANPVRVFLNATQTGAALTMFKSLNTSDDTYYDVAFSQITSIINSDNPATNNESYVVIFMSDGQPTDLGGSANNQLSGVTTLAKNIIGLAPTGHITLSTVYFGPNNDSQSENNLKTMAGVGGGQFIDTNITTQYSIDNLVTVPITACSTP
jgi:hypothetical protein